MVGIQSTPSARKSLGFYNLLQNFKMEAICIFALTTAVVTRINGTYLWEVEAYHKNRMEEANTLITGLRNYIDNQQGKALLLTSPKKLICFSRLLPTIDKICRKQD